MTPKLPPPETYEQELQFMPYKNSLDWVINYVCEHAPQHGNLLDVMCGPGYLLGKIKERRSDLSLRGTDINKKYIAYAKEKYPNLDFAVQNVLGLKSKSQFDVITCTGALHHIPYEKQCKVVKNMAHALKIEGFAIISDCYVDGYFSEIERKLAAAKLGYEYLKETIANGAPEDVVRATAQILENDVLGREFKESLESRLYLFKSTGFTSWRTRKIWPGKFDLKEIWPKSGFDLKGFGDYTHVLWKSR